LGAPGLGHGRLRQKIRLPSTNTTSRPMRKMMPMIQRMIFIAGLLADVVLPQSMRPPKRAGTTLADVRGQETVKEWADKIVRQHRPAPQLDLPDFIQPREEQTSSAAA